MKSATVAERAAAAAQARQAAERDMASADALVHGKAKADQELNDLLQEGAAGQTWMRRAA